MQDTLQKEKKKPRYDFAVGYCSGKKVYFCLKCVFLFGCVHLGAK